MKRVTAKMKEDWVFLREKNVPLEEIATNYGVCNSTVLYHTNPEYKAQQIRMAKTRSKARSESMGIQNERPPCNFAYRLKDYGHVKDEIISAFSQIETREDMQHFLDEKELLLSMFLLRDYAGVSEVVTANNALRTSFGCEPEKSQATATKLYRLCSEKIVEREHLPKSRDIYKITDEGLIVAGGCIIEGGGPTQILLEILQGNSEGMPSGKIAELFGPKDMGDTIPRPYSVFINPKYNRFANALSRAVRSGLIKKERLPLVDAIESGCTYAGTKRRRIHEEELMSKAKNMLSYVRENGSATIDNIAQQFNMTSRLTRQYVADLTTAGFLENISRGTYSARI